VTLYVSMVERFAPRTHRVPGVKSEKESNLRAPMFHVRSLLLFPHLLQSIVAKQIEHSSESVAFWHVGPS
jgi:hypothetical protein